jgi:hypothetical protein
MNAAFLVNGGEVVPYRAGTEVQRVRDLMHRLPTNETHENLQLALREAPRGQTPAALAHVTKGAVTVKSQFPM